MFYRMRLLEKWRKKYHRSIINSWKCIIKTLIRSRKMLLISGNKLQKHIKKSLLSDNKYPLFSL